MVLVIGGKDYHLTNEDWMFPAQNVGLSQGGQMATFKKAGPLGPQMMAQVNPPNNSTSQTLTESKTDN